MPRKPKNSTHSQLIKQAKKGNKSKNIYVEYLDTKTVRKLIGMDKTTQTTKQKRLYPDKYKASRLNGIQVEYVTVSGGYITLHCTDGTNEEFFGAHENLEHHESADYLICMIQDRRGVNVSKY